ncbi:MAG: asparagine synthase (glutamine-hydrolyzing), partial [Gemmatimonadetes bacterium]|nr:asparagine synthase (glutamine-hydrolyzing) [Gemmatimonadota bacterium]
MCGIAGLVGPLAADGDRLAAMVRAQAHRGPDDRGRWSDPKAGVALGHSRLSVLDLAPRGGQPMASADGGLLLVFNGEIYNYRELRAELGDYPYRTETDSEVILAAYRAWGGACVERFIGMFAFALWDVAEGALFCARDRLGIKPFHWARVEGSLAFASEIKALLAAGVPSSPDMDTWATYLAHGVYDHGEATFFEGVRALPPGHVMTVRPRFGQEPEVSQRPFWDLPALTRDLEDMPDAEAEARLLELMDDAVRLRLRSDVPLGVNLSGGLDSASLMVTVDRQAPGEGVLEAFTAAFDDPRYDETEFAEAVPRRHPWTRRVERLRPADVWDVTTAMTWHQEAPFGGVATAAYHHLHRRALEEGVTVLLEGQGVDEALAGYRYAAPHHHRDLLEAGARGTLRRELEADGRAADDGGRAAAARLRALLEGGRGPVYQDGTSHLRPTAVAADVRARQAKNLPGAPSDPAVIDAEIDALLDDDVPMFTTTPAAGWADVPDLVYDALRRYYNNHYQTFGREVVFVEVTASGESTNDAAMRADAVKIADEIGAFATFTGNALAPIPTVLARELAQRGVICICTTSLSSRFYNELPPLIWSSLPTMNEYAVHAAEYAA